MAIPELTHQQVRAYLQARPDFFTDPETHELLSGLRIEHKTAGSISLLEYQISLYRKSNRKLVEQLEHLMAVHESNERTRTGFIAVLNALQAAPDLTSLLASLPQWWIQAFDNIEEVKLVFAASPVTKLLAQLSENVVLYSPRRPPKEIENAARSQQHEFGNELSVQLADMFNKIEAASFLLLGDSKKERGAVLLGSTSAARFAQQLSADFALSVARASINRLWDMYAIENVVRTPSVVKSAAKKTHTKTAPMRAVLPPPVPDSTRKKNQPATKANTSTKSAAGEDKPAMVDKSSKGKPQHNKTRPTEP